MKTAILSLLFVLTSHFSFGQSHQKFYPDGYYFTSQEIISKGLHFGWLSIFIKPSEDLKNSVSVRFFTSDKDKWVDFTAKNYFITKDSTNIVFLDQQIGKLIIDGHFIYSNPPLLEKSIVANQTIVFKGTILHNEKIFPIDFTWWEGD